MDAKLIERFWNAQIREPDYERVKTFAEDIFPVLTHKSERMRVYQAHERIKKRQNTKKDLLTVLLFFLKAKSIYRTAYNEYEKEKQEKSV